MFADYSGNKQYISTGNLSENDQAFIFLMDYPNRNRIKIWGRAETVEGDQDLIEKVRDEDSNAKIERVFVFHIEAWDGNCPQYIQPRFTQEEIEPMVEKLQHRIAELEQELSECKNNQ